jgi:hypothetical protein
MSEVKPSNPKDSVGIKKTPLSVLPAQVLMESAVALFEGDRKYGRGNYRAIGVRASVYYDACMRHLMAWYEGQDIDEESGLSHVTKAIAGLMVLRDSMMNDNWTDDRPIRVKNPNFITELNKKTGDLIDKYPNPVKPYTEKNKNEKR